MSAGYRAVTWTRFKRRYDAVLIAGLCLYLALWFSVAPGLRMVTRPPDDAVTTMDAFGTLAFLMLSVILCLGPLARLDARFLPLLYNRRHFGVLTAAVAATHAAAVLGWYFAYASVGPLVGLLSANTSFGQIEGFPFEVFGMAALVVLVVLAATSHDFWLAFLTPPVWKAIHMAVYGAYVAVVLHVGLGALQGARRPLPGLVVALAVIPVSALHALAGVRERRRDRDSPVSDGVWVEAGDPATIADGRARVITPAGGEAVAIFRQGDRFSAVSNVCVHQMGPLGEGRIVDGCITCPWHGYQYRAEDGCAPPPFTERIATYRLMLREGVLLLDPRPHPPGTRVEPLQWRPPHD